VRGVERAEPVQHQSFRLAVDEATTPSATVKAASAVQAAPNDSCARSRPGFRAVAENASPDAASRLRTQAAVAEAIRHRLARRRRCGFDVLQPSDLEAIRSPPGSPPRDLT
jgi:hypothetical protein